MIKLILKKLSFALAAFTLASTVYLFNYSEGAGFSIGAEAKAQAGYSPVCVSCLINCALGQSAGAPAAEVAACFNNCYANYCG